MNWVFPVLSKAAPIGSMPGMQGCRVSCLSLGLAVSYTHTQCVGWVGLWPARASGVPLKSLNPSQCLVSAHPRVSSLAKTETHHTVP